MFPSTIITPNNIETHFNQNAVMLRHGKTEFKGILTARGGNKFAVLQEKPSLGKGHHVVFLSNAILKSVIEHIKTLEEDTLGLMKTARPKRIQILEDIGTKLSEHEQDTTKYPFDPKDINTPHLFLQAFEKVLTDMITDTTGEIVPHPNGGRELIAVATFRPDIDYAVLSGIIAQLHADNWTEGQLTSEQKIKQGVQNLKDGNDTPVPVCDNITLLQNATGQIWLKCQPI